MKKIISSFALFLVVNYAHAAILRCSKYNLPGVYYTVQAAHDAANAGDTIHIEPNVWAMYSGDLNGDGNIDGSDYTNWEADANDFNSGYFATDLNGDGNVDGSDYTFWEANANGFVSTVKP